MEEAYSGELATLASYTAVNTYSIDTASAFASMRLWSTAGGAARTTTTVALSGSGVDGRTFNAYLHSQPCSQDGGGHYMYNVSGPADAINENWPILTCTGTTCSGEATTVWQPTATAIAAGLSIVIHDTLAAGSGSGAKFMCADLAAATPSPTPSSTLAPTTTSPTAVAPTPAGPLSLVIFFMGELQTMDTATTAAIRDAVKAEVVEVAGADTVVSVTLERRGAFTGIKAVVIFAPSINAVDVVWYVTYFTANPMVITVGGTSMTSTDASSVAVVGGNPSVAPSGGSDGEDDYTSIWLILGICLGICCCVVLLGCWGCRNHERQRRLSQQYSDESKHLSNDDVIFALFPQISPGKQIVNPVFGRSDSDATDDTAVTGVKPAVEESFGFADDPATTDVDRHMRKLTAYYDKYAPGTKSQAELKPIAEHTAAQGTEWLNSPLKTKYGCSFDDFHEVEPEPAGFGFDEVTSDADPVALGVARHLNHLQQYYTKNAPNTKTEKELTEVAEHCDKVGIDWIDAPLKAKYGESLSEFLETIEQFDGFGDDEAPAAAAPHDKLRRQGSAVYAIQSGSDVHLAQLQAYYSKHAPGQKSTAELKPVAEHCATEGTNWLQAPLKQKYGQSLDEFLATQPSSGTDDAAFVEPAAIPAGDAGSLEPDVKKYYQELEAYYEKHAPGQKTFADLKPIAEHCAGNGSGWMDTPLKGKYGQSLTEFLTEYGSSTSNADPAVANYLSHLQKFYGKHAPGTKTNTELIAVAEHCAKLGSGTWLDAPLKTKYGESFSDFTGADTETFGFDDEESALQAKPLRRKGSAVYAIESGADTYLQQLQDYYTKHAPGEKSTEELKPIAEHCASQGGSSWLEGLLAGKYGESLADFLAEQKSTGANHTAFAEPEKTVDGDESSLVPSVAKYYRQIKEFYDHHAPGQKTLADIEPMATHCDESGGWDWMDVALKQKYSESLSEFVARCGDDNIDGTVNPAVAAIEHMLHRYYAKHAPGTKTTVELTAVAEHCVKIASTAWLDAPLEAKYGESFSAFKGGTDEPYGGGEDESPTDTSEAAGALEPVAPEAGHKLRRKGSAVYAIQSGADTYLQQLKYYYAEHCPGEKSTAELNPVAEHCVTEGTGWLQAPLKKKYGQSLDEFLAVRQSVPQAQRAVFVEADATTEGGGVESLEPEVKKHYQQLKAYYKKHAPGQKTFSDLKPIAEHCAGNGSGWLDTPLKGKYGQSLAEFLSEDMAPAPAPQTPMPQASAVSAVESRDDTILEQLQAFYNKHAPGEKSAAELQPVADHCATAGTSWLNGPMQAKYGQTLDAFIAEDAAPEPAVTDAPAIEVVITDDATTPAPEPAAIDEPAIESVTMVPEPAAIDEPAVNHADIDKPETQDDLVSLAPDVRAFYDQLAGYYEVHAQGEKTFAEIRPIAEHCVTVNGTGWMDAALKVKYGESMEEFLGRDKRAADVATVDAAQFIPGATPQTAENTDEFTYTAPTQPPAAAPLPAVEVHLPSEDEEELYGDASIAKPTWGEPQNEPVSATLAGPDNPHNEQETYDTVVDETEQEHVNNNGDGDEQELYINDTADGEGLYDKALDHELAVGDRVTVSSYDCRGTIRAVLMQRTGSVFKKVNVGVELDASVASQVDGRLVTTDHLGVHFFKTAPGAGVLVAVNRVTVVPADEDPYQNMQAEADEGSYRNVAPDAESDAESDADADADAGAGADVDPDTEEDPYAQMPPVQYDSSGGGHDDEGSYRNVQPEEDPVAAEDPYAQMPPVQYDSSGGSHDDEGSYRNVQPEEGPVAAEPVAAVPVAAVPFAELPVAALPGLPVAGDAASRRMSLELVTQQFKLLEQTMAMLVQANMAAPPTNGAAPPIIAPAAAPPAAASPVVEPAPGSDAAINRQKAQLQSTMIADERRAREERAHSEEQKALVSRGLRNVSKSAPTADERKEAAPKQPAAGRFPTRHASLMRGQSLMDRVRAQAQVDVESEAMSLVEAKRVITSSLADSHPDKVKAREVIAAEISRLKNA